MHVKGITAAAMAVVAVPFAALLTAAPASASWYCPTGAFCIYSDSWGNGGYNAVGTLNFPWDSNFQGDSFSNGVPLNDNASSAYNSSSKAGWALYSNSNYSGTEYWWYPWHFSGDFATFGFNDVASSGKCVTDCGSGYNW